MPDAEGEFMLKFVKALGLLFSSYLLVIFFQNCQNAKIEIKPPLPDGTSSIFNNSDNNNPDPNFYKTCYTDKFNQASELISKKTDILIVADTSGSLSEERAKIASEIKALVQEIPSSVDYQIAIMPAHGSRSSLSGKLWNMKGEPLVLSINKMSVDQISTSLGKSLLNMVGDSYSDGGEEGLFSLSQGLSSNGLELARQQGFFRADAALAVLFVSDENDICYRYPNGLVQVPDPEKAEGPAFVRDCSNITPSSVYSQLLALQQDRPLLVSGAIYTDLTTISNNGENELGYGYLDIIALNQGIKVDLAQPSFHDGLKKIGELIHKRLQLKNRFALSHVQSIDPKSLRVSIDGNQVKAEYIAGGIQLFEQLGGFGSQIIANYCEFPEQSQKLTHSDQSTLITKPEKLSPTTVFNPDLVLPSGAIDANADGVDDVTGELLF